MSYYRGDYYQQKRGDYYRGDPISLGGMIGGIVKVAGGAVGGLLSGGPLGAVTGGAKALGSILGIGGSTMAGAGIVAMPGGGMIAGPPKPGLGGLMERILPGGETGYLKRRRMNVTNPKALRRSIRRVAGFGKLVQRSKRAIARANTAVGNKSGKRR